MSNVTAFPSSVDRFNTRVTACVKPLKIAINACACERGVTETSAALLDIAALTLRKLRKHYGHWFMLKCCWRMLRLIYGKEPAGG